MTARIEAALPFWLDRPDVEAMQIAQAASDAGISGLWIGEMATFDAFALATAIGLRSPRMRLKVGPLPISVRNPAAIALGVGSVVSLTGCPVDIALGASSPAIVTGWHGRDWAHSAARMRETIHCVRPILRAERSDFDGEHLNSHGFRLRNPLPETRIGVGAFGPTMLRLAAEIADEVVLNLATPQRVAHVREQTDRVALAAGRTPPHLTVWVPVALNPGEASIRQTAGQLAVYLGPPGYGEMFCELGFADLVHRARAGARRSELAAAMPIELHRLMGAVGTAEEIAERLREYWAAGADTVAVVPATADDPAGYAALQCAASCLSTSPHREVSP